MVVAGVPYGFQGDSSDGRWLSAEHRAKIEACHPSIELIDPSVADLNGGLSIDASIAALLVETSGVEPSWEELPGILLGSAFQKLLGPDLLLVQSCSAGVEQVLPLIPAGVALCNASGVHAAAIAETVMASILVDAKLLYQRRIDQTARAWKQLPCRELTGTTMVVVGAGHIGGEVARLAQHFGIRMVGVRRNPHPTEHFVEIHPPSRLHEVVARADYLVVACPLTRETEGLIGDDVFAATKPGCYLVNVSRGRVVDEAAMLRAFASGPLRSGFLDCHVTEPLPDDHPLWSVPGLDISPHDSHASQLLGDRHVDLFCRNLSALYRGDELANRVAIDRGY